MDDNRIPKDLAGHFLISETDLLDPNFFRSVVLITDHGQEGAFGLIVNRAAHVCMQDILPEFTDCAAGQIPVFIGGPVEQQYLFLLHDGLGGISLPGPSTMPVDGVFFQPLTENIAKVLRETYVRGSHKIHIFAGYSGWENGQLEMELDQGAWLVHPASSGIVFHPDPEKGWKDAMSSKGDLYRIIAQTGFKPSIN